MIWIKIENATPEKPEMLAAARICGVSKAEAFLAFFRLWAWLDENTADGFLPALVPQDLDEPAKLAGFGDAMVAVGWITADRTGLLVANWDRHNGENAKKRAMNQKRMQKKRAQGRWK